MTHVLSRGRISRRAVCAALAVTPLLGVSCRDSSGLGSYATWSSPGPHGVGVIRHRIAHAEPGTGMPRPLDAVIWYPAQRPRGIGGAARAAPRPDAAAADGPFPIAVFSHGSGGLPEQSLSLVSHLASHGIVVLAPPHPGNTLRDCFPCLELGDLRASLRQRPGDVQAVLEEAARLNADAASPLRGRLTLERVGVLGHSLGGATALLVAAQNQHVGAVVALAPALLPEVTAAGAVTVPTLLMNGDADVLTPLSATRRFYEGLPTTTPRALVTVLGGDHLVFTRPHAAVQAYAAAFLRRFLADDSRGARTFDPARPYPTTTLLATGLH